jgi:hypothetical protein
MNELGGAGLGVGRRGGIGGGVNGMGIGLEIQET